MNDKLRGNYNKIICNYCGAAASIIFDILANDDELRFKEPGFTYSELKSKMQFMDQKEVAKGIKALLKDGYVNDSMLGFMCLTIKSNVLIEDKSE